MDDIRQIATSFGGHIVALAEATNRVQIFDILNQSTISEFDTILDFGGQRLAISEDGNICICGCWSRYGICAYDTKTGKQIWQRKELKKVQHIQTLGRDNKKIFANFETGKSRILDITTGEDIDSKTGAKYYFQSRYQPIDIIDKSNKIQLVNGLTGKTTFNIARQSFATLSVAIAKNSFAISESAGPLSCYNIESGEYKWHISLGREGHFLNVCFNERLDQYIGVSWPFAKGGDNKIRFIHKDNGRIEKEYTINSPIETAFAIGGQVLITSDREIINLETGEKKNWA